MGYDNEIEIGAWITVVNGQYFIELSHPFRYRGKIIAESSGEPIEPGFFLVGLFNADYTDTISLPVILDDLMAVQKGIPYEDEPETWKTSTDLQKTWEKVFKRNPALQKKTAEAIQNTINRFEYTPGTSLSDDTVENTQIIQNMERLSERGLEDVFNNIIETLAADLSFGGTVEICSVIIAELLAAQLYDTVKTDGKIDYASFSDSFDRIRTYSNLLLDGFRMSGRCMELINRHMPCASYDFIENRVVPAYYLRTAAELFALDAYYYSYFQDTYCFCKLCGRYFKKKKRRTEAFCSYPNAYLGGMTCREYHKENPKYEDAVTALTRRAIKTQNKYCNEHPENDNSHTAWVNWTKELKERENTARITRKISPLKQFIKNTRFSKTGFSITDYSEY